ncbi:MAG: GGDEF domain-containing protein [Fuerstiella sp.]|nr:GGDEF domain-containing protein [Fuerstiella sp.]
MLCSKKLIRVHWFAGAPYSSSSRLEIKPCDLSTDDCSGECDVRVLEFFDKKNALKIRNIVTSHKTPVLLLVGNDCFDEAFDLIREEDDLCLIDSPWMLIEHRLCRLQKNAANRLDSLTALRSRKELIRHLGECCAEADSSRPVSVIFLDLDHFKALNDQHGHAVGDNLLVECGELLNEYTSQDFFVARFGGEEFVLVSRLDEESTRRTAEHIRITIASHEFPGQIRMSTSIGISTTETSMEVSDLLSQADEALYAAKAGGRDLVYTWNQLKAESSSAGEDVDVTGLENHARVFSERVTSFITRRSKKLISGLKHEASTDGLTQIYNRRYLDSQLSVELAAAEQHAYPLCIALIDVDHFGQVNKTHGWPTGDLVLKQVSSLIQSNLRKTDWVGRYGGEEFCVVLIDATLSQARFVLERLRSAVEKSLFESTAGVPLAVTISIGLVEQDVADTTPVQLLERASRETLAAKNAGRNCLRPQPEQRVHQICQPQH